MIGKTPGSHDPSRPKNIQVPDTKLGKSSRKDFKDTGSGKIHKFGCMTFTEKQWKRFIANMTKMILVQVKQDEKRMKKAADKLKKSIEGKE